MSGLFWGFNFGRNGAKKMDRGVDPLRFALSFGFARTTSHAQFSIKELLARHFRF